MFAGEYNTYADYVSKHKEFFPDVYEPDYEDEEDDEEED